MDLEWDRYPSRQFTGAVKLGVERPTRPVKRRTLEQTITKTNLVDHFRAAPSSSENQDGWRLWGTVVPLNKRFDPSISRLSASSNNCFSTEMSLDGTSSDQLTG
jgi:hypothetical protein